MSKIKIHLMGWITILVFPIPAFLALHYLEGWDILRFLQLDSFAIIPIGYGLQIGIVYAFFSNLIMQSPLFEQAPMRVDELVRSMNLRWTDALFLSLCAGVGEELLFRVGVQYYLGPFITAILFVAIHGYLNPFKWRSSLYGFIVLPFSFILGYGFIEFGLWFSISAHFSYDAVLFFMFIHSDQR